jgi:hypothetical protein
LPKRNFDIQKYETENYDESPLPGEMLVFKDTGEYTPPEEPKEEKPKKKKEKKEESRSLKEMYGQDPDLIREVIAFWGLNWPQIEFVATHGAPAKSLAQWRAEAEAEHEARQEEYELKARKQGWSKSTRNPFKVSGQPVRFSKLKLIQFYRRYEKEIWNGTYEFITSTEGGHPSPFEALAKCVSFANVQSLASLNDIAAAAAQWAVTEACQMVYQDWDSNHDREEGSPEDYAQFRDIWEPKPEHHELHTDVGGYDESLMRRLRRGN